MTKKRDPAEALARALEGDEGAVTKEIASLVSLARMLEHLPEPQIDAGFAGGLEAAILGKQAPAAAAAVAPVVPLIRRPSRRMQRALVAAIAAAMVLALPVVASANAEPGSALYGAKLRRERVALWWACRADAVQCGFTHLDLADERLRDLRAVVSAGTTRWVRPTMARFRSHLSTGTSRILDVAPPMRTLRRLHDRLGRAATELQAIAGGAPAEVREALAPVIISGDDLTRQVAIALGLPDTSVRPPDVSVGGPPPRIAAPPPSREQPDQASRPRSRGGRTPNTQGPGGVPRINPPPPGETWNSDDPVRDECPVAVVAAVPSDPICGLTPEAN